MTKSIQAFLDRINDKTSRIPLRDLVWGTSMTYTFRKANVDSRVRIHVETGMSAAWMAMISIVDDIDNTTATMECLEFIDGLIVDDVPIYAVDDDGNIDYDTYIDLPFVKYDDVDIVVSETGNTRITSTDKAAAAVATLRSLGLV